ncbi:exostosin domain-containing protein [Granulosicoccus sp. 3-233]|uniref:exostosin domain-containing protein n=1 Tax=Granulosicoccus sp. 3-233 TaxID=3417969 RepID=UPI003D35260A
MKLYFASAYQTHPCLDRVRELARLDKRKAFVVTDDAEAADAIIFVENTQFDDMGFKTLLSHELLRRYPTKVFMYNEADRAWPVLNGLYCSLACNLSNPGSQVAFPYLTAANTGIRDIYRKPAKSRWLYSFVGSQSHSSRKPLLKLPATDARIVDTSDFCTWDPMQTSRYAFQKLYTDTIAASKFVLCPRGIGPASLRLYETLEAGRVPVIISDTWVAPPQIDWNFAVRVPEWQVADIPDILHALEPEWQDRAEAARKAWESAYAPDQMFNTLGMAIESIRFQTQQPRLSLQARALKWRVIVEQEIRHQLKPRPAMPLPKPRYSGELENLFPRKSVSGKR